MDKELGEAIIRMAEVVKDIIASQNTTLKALSRILDDQIEIKEALSYLTGKSGESNSNEIKK